MPGLEGYSVFGGRLYERFNPRMAAKMKIGYCTNVHAGIDLETAKANLLKHACVARDAANWSGPLGVGLWLAEPAAREAAQGDNPAKLRDWLVEHGLDAFTMNGFPQGNFHEPIVKHRVYLPTWWDPSRLEYTRNLVRILSVLIPEGGTGSISTLPIAWGMPRVSKYHLVEAAEQFSKLAEDLAKVEEEQGRQIVIAIEPEPGCEIGDASTMRSFFQRYLLNRPDAERIRKYITVCHDICHAAVMREDQGRELKSYVELGMRIGKVQVSSAILVEWDLLKNEEKILAFEQLKAFAEDRYLHQTTTRSGPAGSVRLHEDLPRLIQSVEAPTELSGSWCVHFHVPIFLSEFGLLKSTRPEIDRCIQFLTNPMHASAFTNHWEVETYAWGVLPQGIARANLAEGIADELKWFRDRITPATT